MTLDLTKPIRHRITKKPYKFLHKLVSLSVYDIVVLSEGEKGEMVFVHSADSLENIPESRWLNVYENCNLSSTWKSSRLAAEIAMSFAHMSKCVGIIEDKQDGSPWIVHQLS